MLLPLLASGLGHSRNDDGAAAAAGAVQPFAKNEEEAVLEQMVQKEIGWCVPRAFSVSLEACKVSPWRGLAGGGFQSRPPGFVT